jgi:hypothetical protein
MSRGPGHVERTVEALFTSNPTSTYSTSELVAAVYPGVNRAEKKHRVAVLRAATKIAKRLGGWAKWICERWYWDDPTDLGCIFVNKCDVHSYAMGRWRTDALLGRDMPVDKIAREIKKDPDMAKFMSPGGIWWAHVQRARIARGDVLDAETLHLVEIAEAEMEQWLAKTGAALRGQGSAA